MAEMESWFYSDDEAIYNKATIETKSKNLNELVSKVYKRFHDWGKLGEVLINFESIINSNLKTFNERYTIFTQGAGSLNQQECEEIQALITENNNKLNEWRTQSTSYPKHLDCPVSHETVSKQGEELTKVLLFNLENKQYL